MAKQKTTRDTDFNYIKDDATSTISSIVSQNASNKFKNVRLLDLEAGVSVTGQKIKTHAENNHNMDDMGEYAPKINTDNISATGTYHIYGAPFQVVLNNRQHYNNCGIESTLNNLAMAGMIKMKDDLSDQKKVEKDFLKTLWNLGLAADDGEIGKLDEADGGTYPDYYRDIFTHLDIASEAYYYTRKCEGTQYSDLNELAYKISQGYGAVLGLCSKNLWQQAKSETGEITIDHAVTITGVVYEEGTEPANYDEEGNIISYNTPVGFYIHDTGAWMSRYISLDEFKEVTLYDYHGMLESEKEHYYNYDDVTYEYDPDKYLGTLREFDTENRDYVGKQPGGIVVTITSEPIKTGMFDLNVTGDSQDNTIWGNSGENIIKGMSGKDTLYGNAGDDEIRGGSGNDIIIGNNLSADDKDDLQETFGIDLSGIETSEIFQQGDNILYGDSGNDIILSGAGYDLIYGGSGNDFIWTGDGRNAAYGEDGNDILLGGSDVDRLFGDSGDDTIYGFGDDDIISGGAGKDHIYGGRGNDRIETGSGDDVVYFEGYYHGADSVTSQSGKTYLKFIDEMDGDVVTSEAVNVSDMSLILDFDENTNKYNLKISHKSDVNSENDTITFSSICNQKAGAAKSLNIVESDDTTYKVSVSKSKKITAGKGNNILFSLYEKGATIKTNAYNDLVTMVETAQDSDAYKTRVDKITYTGGQDSYISEEGDTYYTVNGFDENTVLAIHDNVEAVKKIEMEGGLPVIKEVVSTDDRLYFDCAKSDLKFFFDVGIGEGDSILTTKNDDFFIFNSSLDINKVLSLLQDDEATGLVYVEAFLDKEKDFAGGDIYGNGNIEHIYYQNETPYANLTTDLTNIASQVADWLSATDYTSAFEVFNDATLDVNVKADLLACYTTAVV